MTTNDSERSRSTNKTTKKRPAQKGQARRNGEERPASARTSSRPKPAPLEIAAQAAEQLVALTGREPEGVTGMERTEDGWAVQVEVLELRRVPTTTDVLGLYEVRTDERGELQGYRRLRRYARGAANDE